MGKLFSLLIITIMMVVSFSACSVDNEDSEKKTGYSLTINEESYEPTSTGELNFYNFTYYLDVYLFDSSRRGNKVTELVIKFKNQKLEIGDTIKNIEIINWDSVISWNAAEYDYVSGIAMLDSRKEVDNSYGSKDTIITVEYKDFTFKNERSEKTFVMNGKIDYEM